MNLLVQIATSRLYTGWPINLLDALLRNLYKMGSTIWFPIQGHCKHNVWEKCILEQVGENVSYY